MAAFRLERQKLSSGHRDYMFSKPKIYTFWTFKRKFAHCVLQQSRSSMVWESRKLELGFCLGLFFFNI
jgi:hypothetical protein